MCARRNAPGLKKQWPHRRQAGSHRYRASLKACGVSVGAGLPAMGPGQAKLSVQQHLGPDLPP
ncbi:hypothetical protein DVB73_11920 [Pseudomonas plecoglossicida]|uniref:Uncharacterized protein n=1 Tax=Pseudomonas plecoglossicida TaxID=70775 RepID=A0AAD0R1N2_PSEDL|nr:hypothetical protein DVB73_11920 [Pseudomonas plecoglossicida]